MTSEALKKIYFQISKQESKINQIDFLLSNPFSSDLIYSNGFRLSEGLFKDLFKFDRKKAEEMKKIIESDIELFLTKFKDK